MLAVPSHAKLCELAAKQRIAWFEPFWERPMAGILSSLSLVLILASAQNACAADSYYVLIFSWQRGTTHVRCTHTFATFVKVTADGSSNGSCLLEAHTISWLPEKMDVHPWRLLCQRGRNFDLETSLDYAFSHQNQVCLWGPFQVRRELYELGMKQIVRLEQGTLQYKTIDTGYPCSLASNCIHAVTDLIPARRRIRLSSPGWGEGASKAVAVQLKPWMIDACTTHPWVAACLELDRYPIAHRTLQDP